MKTMVFTFNFYRRIFFSICFSELFYTKLWCFVSGSYWKHYVSSSVIMIFKEFGSIAQTCDLLTPVISSMSLMDIQRSCLSKSRIFMLYRPFDWSMASRSLFSSDSLLVAALWTIHKLMYGIVLCPHKSPVTLLMFLC